MHDTCAMHAGLGGGRQAVPGKMAARAEDQLGCRLRLRSR